MSGNLGHSVRHRLLNRAKAEGADYNSLLLRYANERLLYRLSRSNWTDAYVLKGATLFTVWTGKAHRATRDLDLLACGDNSIAAVEQVFRALCAVEVEDDGLTFDAASVHGEPIREEEAYLGVRIRLLAHLTTARLSLQVDVGFGDAVYPTPVRIAIPTLLDFPAPTIRAYAPETTIAEKYHAMVDRGLLNSRLKDYYDIYVLSRTLPFDERLGEAIRATFTRRGTPVPTEVPVGLSREFADHPEKRAQWSSFLKKAGLPPLDLPEVVGLVRHFLTRGAATGGSARDTPEPDR
ncbi:nucleotidyl transferase AbiEii/AbiGii toxin family protein [Myxococcota bacterium]|nr:nucleotidyl transferase AbiEii/AbiGii toxin family protein [Myxococcota bacterium]